jgi:quinoprotein glucose dehydrogenase
VEKHLTTAQISDVIQRGKGRMPSFSNLTDSELEALLQYIRTGKDNPTAVSTDPSVPDEMVRYRFTGYRKFYDPDGYPAISPPWGTLNAIDLNSGKYLWRIPFGEYPELTAKGIPITGTENYGGPIVTAGGLLFIGATIFDRRFRAYDSHSGNLLWFTELPYAALATPVTYMVDGKQYVVTASSGGRDPKSPKGGAYVAFALP